MEFPEVVEVDLLTEDWAQIQRALRAAGRVPEDDLPWLLEHGLGRFMRDETEWKALEGRAGPEAEALRQELQRRETQALLVSIRAQTIAAEMVMHDLGESVHALGADLKKNRQAMRALREESAALQTRLQGLDGSDAAAAHPARGRGAALRDWLRFLWEGVRPHG